jgi:hypothetical protein
MCVAHQSWIQIKGGVEGVTIIHFVYMHGLYNTLRITFIHVFLTNRILDLKLK